MDDAAASERGVVPVSKLAVIAWSSIHRRPGFAALARRIPARQVSESQATCRALNRKPRLVAKGERQCAAALPVRCQESASCVRRC